MNLIVSIVATLIMEWNLQQINMDSYTDYVESTSISTPVKVAIIDSGIDYTSDIDVYCRKNFIPNEDNISIIYEDLSGHGTSVASIIAAKDNNEGATGINSNVQLYSARVLDANCSAPVSRVVEAIYWAIDQGVNIINISFGTTENSEELHTAIQAAENAGILLIAAAGNNGIVEYPAAYEEVMSVGSVNSQGKVSDFSAKGEELEIVAPGESVLSTGDFGGISVYSGTSIAAPHIVGVASLLWEKDLSVSADCIRKLLDVSANLYGEQNQYGYGLVDVDYAFGIYDDFIERYNHLSADVLENDADGSVKTDEADVKTNNEVISNNENEVSVFSDVTYVEGSWSRPDHENLVIDNNTVFTATDIKAIKAGCTANDNFIAGMEQYPQWHGYWQQKVNGAQTYESNYMASYIYLTKIAQQFPNNTSAPTAYSDPSKLSYMTTNDYNGLKGVVTLKNFNGTVWSTALKGYQAAISGVTDTNRNRRLFMYGVAIHSATDAWAHDTYTTSGNYISHTDGSNAWQGSADITTYIKSRYNCAGYMTQLILARASAGTDGSAEDFCKVAASSNYASNFLVMNFADNVKAISTTIYNSTSYSSAIEAINID